MLMFDGVETIAGKQAFRLRHFRETSVRSPNLRDITTKEAVEAIQDWSSSINQAVTFLSRIKEQSKALLEKLQEWCEKYCDFISRADVRVVSGDDFLFVVMQKSVPYDFDLSEKLTDLDMEIANSPDFDLITLNVLAIPRCSYDAAQAFIDWEHNICVVDFTNNAEFGSP